MGGTCKIRLLLIGFVIVLALLAPAASAASDTTTSVHVVKVASDGKTVLAEQTVDYRWLEANLPVRGDGSTHYYHQGPTNDPADLWDPAESKSFQDDDMGALKGTAVRDICNLVGGMAPGDTLKVGAADGYPSKPFSYGTVYTPSARQGPMVLTWYRGGDGYVPAYWSGMKIVFFADTSTNANHWHVFGISDMRASMPESEWYYKYDNVDNIRYPSTTGLAIRYVKELKIYSTQAPKTATVAPTKTPTPTGKPSGTTIPTATATPTVTTMAPPTSTLPTTTGGTGVPTTAPSTTAVPSTTVPAVGTTTTVPSDDGVPVVVTTTLAQTPTESPGTPTTGPTSTDGANATVTATGLPSPTENATANQTPTITVPTVAPTYERTYEYSVAPEIVYVVVEQTETATTTPTVTPTASPSPDPSAAAAGPSTPAITTAEPATPTVTVTAGPADRVFNRSVSFTFSVRVRESGDPALAASGALSAWLTAFLRAFAYIAGIFLP